MKTNNKNELMIKFKDLEKQLKAILKENEVSFNDDISSTEFKIYGRLDNVIISGGIKIHAEEVENKLSHYLDHPFFISSTPDPKWGEKVVMIVEGEVDINKMNELCANVLAPHEKPKEILTFKKLCRTENGKIIRIIPPV